MLNQAGSNLQDEIQAEKDDLSKYGDIEGVKYYKRKLKYEGFEADVKVNTRNLYYDGKYEVWFRGQKLGFFYTIKGCKNEFKDHIDSKLIWAED